MEMSHQSSIIKAEFGVLCNEGYYTFYVSRYLKNDLLLMYIRYLYTV
jgi:hypothetical protein